MILHTPTACIYILNADELHNKLTTIYRFAPDISLKHNVCMKMRFLCNGISSMT